jgi:sulfane dehydrogenase subunit SoxC
VSEDLEPGGGAALFEAQELRMATRNRGVPLEALRYDITPTGLHYLLIHFDIPFTDAVDWRLEVRGAVRSRFTLTMDEIHSLPSVTAAVTLECAGNGRALLKPRPVSQPWLLEACSTAEWTGTPLRAVLERAGVADDALEVVFTGADRGVTDGDEHDYARSLSLADAMRDEVLLAYAMNGRPLEPQHGAPLRLIVPGWYGMASVKWLHDIEVVTEPFEGFEQLRSYRYQTVPGEIGEPVTRMNVRALMIPPGMADTLTRQRYVEPGRHLLCGRAWSGNGVVERVEVGIDGSWADAVLADPVGEHAWRGWSYEWDAVEGLHELQCRATDATGHTQPLDQRWTVQGMGNNMAQRVIARVG